MLVQATPPSLVKQTLTFEEIVGQHAGAIADCNVRIRDARLAQEQARAGQAQARAAQAQARVNQARALEGCNEVLRKSDAAKMQVVLSQVFHTIFSKNPLPPEEISALFTKYLAEKDMVMVLKADGKSCCPKLTSMRPVIRYLDDHPGLKSCDLRELKTEIGDIPTLAKYVSRSECTIKVIGINQGISDADKASLQKAVTERKGGLKVQYSA